MQYWFLDKCIHKNEIDKTIENVIFYHLVFL